MSDEIESVIFWCLADERCLCGTEATVYCDWPGCDAPMCDDHVVHIGDDDLHWCRAHIFFEPKPEGIYAS